jgi:diguanylate cyclase (GGDEF)-like protein
MDDAGWVDVVAGSIDAATAGGALLLGAVLAVVGFARRRDRDLRSRHAQYVDVVERIQLALFVFRPDDPDDAGSMRLLALNPEAASLLDRPARHVEGVRLAELIPLHDHELVVARLADVTRTGQGWIVDGFRLDPGSPRGRIYSAHAFPLPEGAVGLSLHDVTEREIAGEVLRRQALHDGLTGLPNRTLLNDRLHQALAHSRRTGDPVALLVMDLDQFKEVNDALGHDHGDRLLVEMSRRLQGVLRDVDTIARLGGDEFAVLVTDAADERSAVAVARRVRAALEQPFRLGGISLQTDASIGVALHPRHAHDAETLTRRADVAMYTAKRSGRGIALYDPDLDRSSVVRLALLGELRAAIATDELHLEFQPAVDLRTGEARGAEALVRWTHPVHGRVPPSELVELAEVSGLIQPLTRWVLRRAVAQARWWLDAGLDLTVAVNLSVRNLYDPELVPWVSHLLEDHRLPPDRLAVEITETRLMDDPAVALEVLGRLKALGVSTSVDDFGTGYSSLAYLKHLPLDELKVDRSFVIAMAHDDNDLTIVRSTIDLSHNLGLEVVAEGVEDAATLRALAGLGCDRAQGYLISPPLTGQALAGWAVERRVAPVTPAAPLPRPALRPTVTGRAPAVQPSTPSPPEPVGQECEVVAAGGYRFGHEHR